MLRAGSRRIMYLRRVLFWGKSFRCWGFVSKKHESSLELAMFVEVKTRDLFPRIRKKIGPTFSLEVGELSSLTIVKEEASATIKKKAAILKGKGKSV